MTKETVINYFRKPYRTNGLDGRPSTLPRSGFVQHFETIILPKDELEVEAKAMAGINFCLARVHHYCFGIWITSVIRIQNKARFHQCRWITGNSLLVFPRILMVRLLLVIIISELLKGL